MYTMPRVPLPVPRFAGRAGASGAAHPVHQLPATLNACWPDAERVGRHSLMLPKAPKAGKRIFLERITPVWKRMKFTHKVTARNLFRYKKRFFMTVIGMAGCTALLVTGFGLKDSISDIVSKQFGEVFTYDFLVTLSKESALKDAGFQELMDDSRTGHELPARHQAESAISLDVDGQSYRRIPLCARRT